MKLVKIKESKTKGNETKKRIIESDMLGSETGKEIQGSEPMKMKRSETK